MTDYVQNSNMIPAVKSAGSFTANTPFDTVVDGTVFYTVEGIRSIEEMQSNKIDLYTLVFQPVGIAEEDYTKVLSDCEALGGVVVILSSRGNPNVYTLSTFLTSYPSVDGVYYDHLCLIVDLGAVPPSLKDKINTTIDHVQQYVQTNVGVDNTVKVASIPTRSYVSKEQADVFESTRQATIAGTVNDVTLIAQQQDTISKQQAYIAELEAQLEALNP